MRHRIAAVWPVLALPIISIALSIVVGSIVIIFSNWLVAGQFQPGLCDRRVRGPPRGVAWFV